MDLSEATNLWLWDILVLNSKLEHGLTKQFADKSVVVNECFSEARHGSNDVVAESRQRPRTTGGGLQQQPESSNHACLAVVVERDGDEATRQTRVVGLLRFT